MRAIGACVAAPRAAARVRDHGAVARTPGQPNAQRAAHRGDSGGAAPRALGRSGGATAALARALALGADRGAHRALDGQGEGETVARERAAHRGRLVLRQPGNDGRKLVRSPLLGRPQRDEALPINLTEDERAGLEDLVARTGVSAERVRRARILLLADADLTDEEIVDELGVGVATVERSRKSAVLAGLAAAMEPRKQEHPAPVSSMESQRQGSSYWRAARRPRGARSGRFACSPRSSSSWKSWTRCRTRPCARR